MKRFGEITELTQIVFKSASAGTVELQPDATQTGTRVATFPVMVGNDVVTLNDTTATLTGKTISAASNTISNLTNSSIAAAAAIDFSKLASLASGNILVGNGSAVATSVAVTGDVLLSNAGVTSINSGAIVDGDINAAAAIDASKIADGSVSSTEFQYLANVTSDIQSQFGGKQPLDADLTALAGVAATGLLARTGAGTAEARTLTGTSNRVTVSNGDGVAGNPTLDIGTDVVTLTGTQALTNKDIDGGTAANTRRITLPKDTTANINGLTRKEGTLLYDTTTSQVKFDNGTTLAALSSSSVATPTAQGTTTSYFATIQSSVKTINAGDWTANAYTVTTTDGFQVFRCETSSTARTLNLPAAADNTGRVIEIKLIGSTAAALTIDPNSSEMIEGLATYQIQGYSYSIVIVCTGTSWEIVSEGPSLHPAFSAETGTATSIPSTSVDTKVTMDQEIFDIGGYYDTSTSRFTPKVAGIYHVSFIVRIDGINSEVESGSGRYRTRFVGAGILKNGTIVNRVTSSNAHTGSAFLAFATCTALISMNGSTDYVEAAALQNDASGSSLNTVTGAAQCRFEAHYVGRNS